ncbi:hypothetical protein WBG78_20495 [Chryseolinea sp. T2]|uniref:hypothetical protein n=1 Tax=Chryseolinea sp. T2 TaxID=3129255 RepID=UPI003077DD03
MLRLTSILLLYLAGMAVVQAQDTARNKKERKKSKKEAPEKGTIYFSPVPVIGANPAFGFIYGAGASVSWFMGEPATTKISNGLLGVAFTTKSQTIITAKSTVYGC